MKKLDQACRDGARNREPIGGAATASVALRLLATTDLHMHIAGFDYLADRPDHSVGLARIATLIAEAREDARRQGRQVLLFDNGDAMQGAPLGDLVAGCTGQSHPMARAFAHLRYDAIGLGNHDFDFGIDALNGILADVPFPVVASNLRVLDPGALAHVSATAVLDLATAPGVRPLRVGILSFLPPRLVDWNRDLLEGRVEVEDIVPCARRLAPALRRDGCDLVVALAHSGFGPCDDRPGLENAVIPLAAVPGIDAIVAGHSHDVFPGPAGARSGHVDARSGTVHGTPVVMPGVAGSHLGIIDLDLETRGNGPWRLRGGSSRLRPVSERAPDRGTAGAAVAQADDLLRLIAIEHATARAAMARPVGWTSQPLHGYFSFVTQDRAMAMVAAAQAQALRPLLAGAGCSDVPLLSAVAPARSGGRSGPMHYVDIPPGAVLRRHIVELCPFPDRLGLVVVTGAQLADWLDVSAGVFNRIQPGDRGRALVDPAVPGHVFDVLFGLTYAFDLSVPSRFLPDGTPRPDGGRRVRNLAFAGRPVEPHQRFAVATNSYRLGGGGHVAAVVGFDPVALPVLPVRDAVERFFAEGPVRDPWATRVPWRFAPMPGTWAEARTGPAARAHLEEVAVQGIEPLGADGDGFLVLKVPL